MNRFSYFGLDEYKELRKDCKINYKGMKFDEYMEGALAANLKDQGLSSEEINDLSRIYDIGRSDEFADNIIAFVFGAQLFQQIYLKNDFSHIFIDSIELYTFLKSTELKSVENLRDMLLDMGNKNIINRFGAIYYPDKTKKTFFYSIQDNFTGMYLTDGDIAGVVPFTSVAHFTRPIKDIPLFNHEYTRMFFNFILYIDCFPDSILNSPPDDVKKQYAPYISKCFTIKTDESLIDRAGVTPHFRRGHFRVLRSEVFKKKRFQTVFVRSSFVKGHAKTVLDNADKEQMITV